MASLGGGFFSGGVGSTAPPLISCSRSLARKAAARDGCGGLLGVVSCEAGVFSWLGFGSARLGFPAGVVALAADGHGVDELAAVVFPSPSSSALRVGFSGLEFPFGKCGGFVTFGAGADVPSAFWLLFTCPCAFGARLSRIRSAESFLSAPSHTVLFAEPLFVSSPIPPILAFFCSPLPPFPRRRLWRFRTRFRLRPVVAGVAELELSTFSSSSEEESLLSSDSDSTLASFGGRVVRSSSAGFIKAFANLAMAPAIVRNERGTW
ncbi:hypothetical protein BDZ88DRAFT_416238 [Geranomyces variabilis]|nr:hypothetical protein BDZ88DRAFT_416238 [Geranomyces variabilis]